jgi:hypothetical protein
MNPDTLPTSTTGESHEAKKDNDLEFPREYFEVQAAFAIKWASLTGTKNRPCQESRAKPLGTVHVSFTGR